MTLADKDEGQMTGTFAGLRVLDFSTTIAGPHCARMLADMGAEVIKIETDEGETMRTRLPVRNGCSTAFGQLNVGKKSVVLDLKSPEGVEAVRRLVATADILVENFRPGVMRRLKLDYDSLRALNPKLIYCSISGYGQSGPSAELPAYAPVIHAASGYDMAHLAYQPGRTRPDYCGIYHADVLTGVYAFGAISAALYQRHGTGRPAYRRLDAGIDAQPDAERIAMVAVHGEADPASDVRADRDGGRLCDGRGCQREDLSEPDAGDRPSRMGHRSALCRLCRSPRQLGDLMNGVEAWSRAVTTEKCLAALNAEGVPSRPTARVAEALDDPQIAHRGALAEVEDGGGTFKVLNLPFRMSGASVSAAKRMATLGEHTVAYLRETGLSDDEIAAFAGKRLAAAPG